MKCAECEELRKELKALREEIRQLRMQGQTVHHYHHAPIISRPFVSPTTVPYTPPWTVTCGRVNQ